jgi:hypothetical protein
MFIFRAMQTKCVPSVVGRDVGRVLAGTAEGSSERAAALALVLYSLPFQHRALFVALLKNVVTPVAGTSSSRLDRLSRFLAPLLFDGTFLRCFFFFFFFFFLFCLNCCKKD